MKNHLKRKSAPNTWVIKRKGIPFIIRPKPGAHSMKMGLPILVILRDTLKVVNNLKEGKRLLNLGQVLVDGKVIKDVHKIVGLFDVLHFTASNESYRLIINKNNQILPFKIDAKEGNIKLRKVIRKQKIKKDKIQYTFHDGTNFTLDEAYKIGDVLQFDLKDKKVTGSFKLKEEALVYLTGGKNVGSCGILNSIVENHITILDANKKEIKTLKKFAFVVGDKEAAIKVC